MKQIDFNHVAESITLYCTCPLCGERIDSDTLCVPQPNYMAETVRDSENSDEYEISCDHCDWSSYVSLYTIIDGGYGEVEELDGNTQIDMDEEIPYE